MVPKKDIATRDESAIQQVAGAPSWLADASEGDTSLDSLKEHLVLPALRIVPMQPGEKMKQYKDEFGEGALVITPAGIGVVPHDTWVKVVPLFMFTEFRKWHDRDDAGTNAVMDRTRDPNSEIGRKARSESGREEPYGDLQRMVKGKVQPFLYQYVEHLCFTVLIYEGKAAGTPAVLEFQRGSLWKGKEFASAALMRRVDSTTCPLWTQVWEIQTKEKTGKGYTWWALEFRNPHDGQLLISEEESGSFQDDFKTHRDAHKSQRLVVDLSEADEGEARAVEAEIVDDGEM